MCTFIHNYFLSIVVAAVGRVLSEEKKNYLIELIHISTGLLFQIEAVKVFV